MDFSQGVSNRHNPIKLDRTFHMIVADRSSSTGWRMWCSYGLAREDNPAGYGKHGKLCRKCIELVAERMEDETLDASEAGVFADAGR